MKRIDDHEVLTEIEQHINEKPRLLSEQELDEAIILAAGKRYLHQRYRTLKALFQEQLQATLKLHKRRRKMSKQVQWCNWTFDECVVENKKWLVTRDCSDDQITLTRGDSRNWRAYDNSLKSRYQGQSPLETSKCPNCLKYVNGVNPYDDGETWRMS